ncbi:hypothetical protein [Salinicoccus roseus]|uniref:Uncharacterized protein n=1 Tax=Salinicoccus roseus TaxID=45670 RepID=A0A0C2DJA1_9STAP|nr:hypothetical protein [Salinicoccus roseus]KIH70058.1 hypothetical protein SN16_11190 [Salinicoccus roseus]MDB0581368.1 hypothetical protein [Salinicoccus roseus]
MKTKRNNVLDEHMVKLISEVAIEKYKETEKQEIKLKRDRRLHNVKKLMTNYNRIRQSVEKSKVEAESDMSVEQLMTSEYMIESLSQSKERSKLMVEHVKKILTAYENICRVENVPERYSLLTDRYVDNLPVHILQDRYALSSRTIYREIDRACEDMAVLLFGIDAVRFEMG